MNNFNRIGWTKGLLKANGRRKGLKSLYDSDKWELGKFRVQSHGTRGRK